ncbi:hypothetical protein GGI12_003901 [Dipsacomyces acuminosporus]|nr:hypothetical protein GGI12_003901 [Dipsacomyces acuminosporus]
MYPADSLLVDLVMYASKDEMDSDDPLYKDSRVTVSVDVRPITDDRNTDLARVYQGTVRLYDPGFYKLDATLEHRDSQWNAEPGQKSVGLIGMNLDTEGSVSVIRDLKHPTYLGNHQKLPLCTSADEPGRWIPVDNLPKHWKAWQYVSPAEDGRVWLPYHCRLRRISHAEFTHKMSQKYDSVHWYGDSNSRRSIRPFITAGKWCNEKDSLKRLDCLCNDAPKDLFPDDWYPSRPQPHWYRIHTNGVNGSEVFEDLRKLPLNPTDDKPIPEDDLEAVDDDAYGYGFTPKAYSQRNDYFDLYYLFTRGTRDMYGSYWARDITAQNIAAYRKPSLVIVQMITWDVAFGSYESFIKELPPLIKRLQKVYPNTQFIYRSGPYWCCKDSEDEEKKYSRLRFMAFDHQARRLFKKHLKAGVWDVIKAPSSRPPEVKRLKENLPCLSAHTRAELIHLDNQLLMNMLVNGN